MSLTPELRRKMEQQYELADYQRRLLITELYRLIDDLENAPVIRRHKSFPFGTLERAVHSGLDRFEKKIVHKIWLKLARLRNR